LDKTVPQALFTPDGKGLVFRVGLAGGLADIGFLDLNTGEVNDSLLATEFDEFGMALSPDGRWLAYTSNITGRREVFVRPFPDVDSDFTPVSRDGGNEAMWAPNGGELFFRSEDGWMTAVTYSADSVFIVENWERLFDARPFGSDVLGRGYEISPLDGRFLMVLADPVADSGGGPAPRMIQIQSFFTELEERVGEGH
jgi:serine/threonine-protein kinase